MNFLGVAWWREGAPLAELVLIYAIHALTFWAAVVAIFRATESLSIDDARAQRRIHRSLRFLGVTAAVLPLMGLLGTVIGMMSSFDALRGQAALRGPAIGLDTALVTTQAGLLAAVVVLILRELLRRRHRLNLTAENLR